VMLPLDGRLRVLDFGIAKLTSEGALPFAETASFSAKDPAAAQRSRTGGFAGTPLYMAPEQWRAEPLTPAVDVWAVGVMLHELLDGAHPFARLPAYRVCALVCGADPLPSIAPANAPPPAIGAIIERCLRRDAALRPTAVEIAECLRAALGRGRRPTDAAECPFRGLLPFTEAQADRFFGRDSELSAFIERC
jgi:eukaryotic-like serine/threonine-protein kinase